MFAWVQHLADERYFDIVEIFFLFAGHTHSPIDQNFSVVNHAINRSNFIGSTVAMNELLKVAHDVTDQKNKNTRITEVINLDIYYDYVSYYEEVLNPLIHNHQGPHRYKVEFQKLWGLSNVQYMWQSPHTTWHNVWLPLALPPAEDDLNVEAGIDSTAYMTFGGEEKMLEMLEVDSSQKMGQSLFSKPSTAEAAASKLNAATKAMPVLHKIEINAIAEQQARMEIEAIEGRPATGQKKQSVRVSKALLAEVESKMLATNTANAGHLFFLKRSLCKDGSWQDKRPGVLPNPKVWREQTTTGATPISQEDIIAAALASSSTAQDPSAGAKSKGKRKRTPEELVQDSAVTKLLKFNSGASQMVKTAKYMLDLLEGGVRVKYNPSADIVEATNTFKRAVLTLRDKIFYENISSVANISMVIEKRVAEAEAQPWSLLRLPVIEGVERRREALKLEQDAILAKRAANINRLLSKVNDGFDITRETITRDGKDIIFARTLDDMTIEQLTILVRNAKIVGRSKLTKKPQLIGAINKYLAEHPTESLKSLCGEEDANVISSLVGEERNPIADSSTTPEFDIDDTATDSATIITSAPLKCPVQECEGHAIVSCELCGLQFCAELHSAHNGHIFQQLRQGYRFPATVWGNESDPQDDCYIEEALTVAVINIDETNSLSPQQAEGCSSILGEERSIQPHTCPTSGDELISSAANRLSAAASEGQAILRRLVPASTSFPDDQTEDTTASIPSPQATGGSSIYHDEYSTASLPAPTSEDSFLSPSAEHLLTAASRNKASKRKESPVLDARPEVDVAKKLRAIVGVDTDGKARKLLNFECYNVDFLVKLSYILDIDIKDALSVRRATRESVMKALISKLNS